MISKERKEEIAQVADEVMAKIIRDLPENLKKRVDGAIAGMFGFENRGSWGTWSIDHCNGRNSLISDWISSRAKQEFSNECEKIITKKFVGELIKSAKNVIGNEFKQQFVCAFKKRVKELAKKHAEEEAATYMEGFKTSMTAEMDAIANAAMEGNISETQLAIMETEIEGKI